MTSKNKAKEANLPTRRKLRAQKGAEANQEEQLEEEEDSNKEEKPYKGIVGLFVVLILTMLWVQGATMHLMDTRTNDE